MTVSRLQLAKIVLLLLMIGGWIITYLLGNAYQYRSPFMLPLMTWLGYPFYWPWDGWVWMLSMPQHLPLVALARAGLGINLLVCVMWLWWMRYLQYDALKKQGRYGSARWMHERELQSSGLLAPEGVCLGQLKQRYLRHDGPEHVLAVAPTRTGKGVGLVIPTLLEWKDSVLIHDIKGENWELTAGWRSQFSHCLYFNPTSLNSVRFNPLLQVRKGEHEVKDVQNIADILVEPDGGQDKRDYWAKTGHVLLVASILHILYTAKEKTLAAVADFLSDPSRDIRKSLTLMMETRHLGDRPHPVIASSAREMLNKAESELSGVVSTAMSFLGLYRDPVIARATSTSDFCIDDLIHADKPVSLYLVVPPSDLSRTRPLIRLMLNQISRVLTETPVMPYEASTRRQLLLLMDEFPALGKLDFFESFLAYTASYRIRCFLICQSLNQLDRIYGTHHCILDNCHIRVVFASNDDRTAQRISHLLGTSTQSAAKNSYSGRAFAMMLSQVSVSEQDNARPLLTPGEIHTLPDDQSLILIGSKPPICAQKIRYYLDKRLATRILPVPDHTNAPILFLPEKQVIWLSGMYAAKE